MAPIDEAQVPEDRTATGGAAPQRDGNDDLSYVAFKHEYSENGHPLGPIFFVTKADEELTGEAAIMGGPLEKCECEKPEGEPGERCRRCGKDNERWVTLAHAEAVAQRHGVELRAE
ncbi:MAG TPA: hypothetical protein VK471_11745 [Solirubrobacterales bacterium]|nr:hypothetical protein [Solirubrobacterales bacterium]